MLPIKKTKRVGKPLNEAQRLASKENFMLFQLASIKAQLYNIKHSARHMQSEKNIVIIICYAQDAVDRLAAVIKANQRVRKTLRQSQGVKK